MKIEVGKKYRVGGNCRYTGNVIKITRKAELYGRADCYYEVVSGEVLPEDEDDDNSFLENSPFAKILEPYEDKTIRYIDADKLKAVIRKSYPNDLEILEQIDNVAVEDIQPVIHAEWERRETLMGSFLVCGNCGSFFFATLETAYCPYCGAKMNIRGVQCEL